MIYLVRLTRAKSSSFVSVVQTGRPWGQCGSFSCKASQARFAASFGPRIVPSLTDILQAVVAAMW